MLWLAMTALLTMFLWTGYEVRTQLHEYQAARSEYAQLREQFGVRVNAQSGGIIDNDTPSKAEAETEDTGNPGGIDFDALRDLNPDTVGWIVVPGTGISYPIVQGRDNERYLWHTFSGARNNSGAIFLDYRNAADFSDLHTIVYGHNMRDGSMFAPLHGWAGEHFIIYTPAGRVVFEVFDRQTVPANDTIFQLHGAPTDSGPLLVTLSTCVSGRPHLRYAIQGRHIGH